MATQWELLGQQFVQQYYATMGTSRDSLVHMYHPEGMMTFEGHQACGHQAITQAIQTKMQFQAIQHSVTKMDVQPTPDGGAVVQVTGRLKTDNDPPHPFSQTFVVKPINGSYLLYHDIFRLSIHDTP